MLLWLLLVAVMLPVAVLTLVYSPWSEDLICQYITAVTRDSATRISIERLRIDFPLIVEIAGLQVDIDGEQMIAADRLSTSVALKPLFSGVAQLEYVDMDNGHITMGRPDSALYMNIVAQCLALTDAKITLEDMNIDVADGSLSHARVAMVMNPDTTTVADTVAASPTQMAIRLHRLAVDDIAFSMRMLPTIDSLSTAIPVATLAEANIDLANQKISIGGFTGHGLDVLYMMPDEATLAQVPEIPDKESTGEPWTITIDTVGFDRGHALYTTRGYKPLAGLDFSYIEADSLAIGVRNFYNRATDVIVPLTMSARERCGVDLAASGTLNISESLIKFDDFTLATPPGTDLDFAALLGMGDLTTDPTLPLALTLDGYLNFGDAAKMFPDFASYFAMLGRDSRLYANISADGTSGDLSVGNLTLSLAQVASLKAKGRALNMFDEKRMAGNIDLQADLINLNPIKNGLLDKQTASQINIPRTQLTAKAQMQRGHVTATALATALQGRMSLDADWLMPSQTYALTLDLDKMPVDAFMPQLGVGNVTASLVADGSGYDPFKPEMKLDAALDLTEAIYNGYNYNNIAATAVVADGHADIDAQSTNPAAQFILSASGNLVGKSYSWSASLSDAFADLKSLGFSDETANVTANLAADVAYTPAWNEINARMMLKSLSYQDDISTINLDNVLTHFNTDSISTNLSVHNRDLYAFAGLPMPLDTVLARVDTLSNILARDVASYTINVDRLQRALPKFNFELNAGKNNFLNDILAGSRSSLGSLLINAENDESFAMNACALGYSSPSINIDTITADISQYGSRLVYDIVMNNRRGTFDEWAHVLLNGYFDDNRLFANLEQENISGESGYVLGLEAAVADSLLTVNISPNDPVIAYKPWTVNDDNYLTWNLARRHLDANLHMTSPGSAVEIYTEHNADEADHQEQVTINLADIKISDWVNINPFAPTITGTVSANLGITAEEGNVNGSGTVSMTDFSYDRQRVGSLQADIDVSTDLNGLIRAKTDISIDSVKTITLAGALNDSVSGSPLAMDFSMIHFPLTTVNPFLPSGVAKLSGMLNGQMEIKGTAESPLLDGWLQFDDAAVKANMTATTYAISDTKIPVENNVVRFNNFAVSGADENALKLTGNVDITSMSSPKVDLALDASNFLLCNTSRAAKGADIYGKGSVNLHGTVKGNMNFMAVNANLAVLSGTNLTYVMADAQSALSQQSTADMVKFVNFADTTAVELVDSLHSDELALLVDATLTVENGTTLNVDLSTDGKNKVRIQPNGTLSYSMTPFSDGRLTGRLNIPKGFARYTPPFMTEKLFNLQEDSYVLFTGDMLNPTLNINAVDELRANVTQSGQNSRLINFDVSLAVTGTLENMSVAFDLSTDDDVTVANELLSMSADQRANQAMNMLLYNIYSGPGTNADSNLSGNALYSFLTSQINSWAASTIKGVDLSFGIDQYDRTYNGSTSTTTSYSYQVSKSLFNDRFKIVVGGNYSTDANVDENFSQNLIKDISFEYFLNDAQTMYVRLFRHTGYESILEGEITRTGVGFDYKRKVSNFGSIFRFLHRKKTSNSANAQ